MKTKNLLLILGAFLFITFTGCKKYDDGPTVSPWPKKWRVVNTWKVEKYIIGNISQTVSGNDTYEYKGNGDYIITSGSTSYTGSWEFGSKKETLITTFPAGLGLSSSSESKILRLTSGELWLTDDSGNSEIHYVSAK
jgi:hypothetical protein